MPHELAPCGTIAAYRRHYRRGEIPDEPCREAQRAYSRSRHKIDSDKPAIRNLYKARGRARTRAMYALAKRHRSEYDRLYRVELSKEEIFPVAKAEDPTSTPDGF